MNDGSDTCVCTPWFLFSPGCRWRSTRHGHPRKAQLHFLELWLHLSCAVRAEWSCWKRSREWKPVPLSGLHSLSCLPPRRVSVRLHVLRLQTSSCCSEWIHIKQLVDRGAVMGNNAPDGCHVPHGEWRPCGQCTTISTKSHLATSG